MQIKHIYWTILDKSISSHTAVLVDLLKLCLGLFVCFDSGLSYLVLIRIQMLHFNQLDLLFEGGECVLG